MSRRTRVYPPYFITGSKSGELELAAEEGGEIVALLQADARLPLGALLPPAGAPVSADGGSSAGAADGTGTGLNTKTKYTTTHTHTQAQAQTLTVCPDCLP
jgi:hypothetical protein